MVKIGEITGFNFDDGSTQSKRDVCCFHDDCPKPWGKNYLFVERDEEDWVPICYSCFLIHVAGISEFEVDDVIANAESWHK